MSLQVRAEEAAQALGKVEKVARQMDDEGRSLNERDVFDLLRRELRCVGITWPDPES